MVKKLCYFTMLSWARSPRRNETGGAIWARRHLEGPPLQTLVDKRHAIFDGLQDLQQILILPNLLGNFMDQRRGTTAPDSSQTFGLGKEIIIICSGIALFFFVCGFHQIIRNQQPFMFFPIALVLLFLIAGHLRVRIILNPDHIRVRKMFGSWQLNYSDITSG